MKILNLFIALFLFSTFATVSAIELSSAHEILVQEAGIDKLDFNNLPENEPSNLADFLGNAKTETSLDSLTTLRNFGSKRIIVPASQGMMYIHGELCHVANYETSTIITVFEGPNYGLQTVVDYYGVVRYVNRYCTVEYSRSGGMILRHGYPDCLVITGRDQIVVFQ